MKTFITSWFITLETTKEYEISRKIFSHILQSTKKDIGDHAVIAVEDLVKILDLKKKFLYHFNFIGRSTLGFKGDSIVEASFSSTKRKSNQISTRKTIEKSAMNIVKDSIASSRMKQNLMQQQVDREVCWSRARVKNDLTKYSLGLFCKNFDKRINYFTAQVGEHEWLSMSKDEFTKKKPTMEAPSFKRVRTIIIDNDGFMNCSCGKTGEYLLPCKHICSLVGEENHFSIDMFHVRWHKQFNLLHGRVSGEECSPAQSKLISEFLNTTRATHYDKNGFYKGVPMKGSSFVKSLPKFSGYDKFDEKLNFMIHVRERSLIDPIKSTSISLEEFNQSEISNEKPVQTDILGDFSLLSQEEFQGSETYFFPEQRVCHKSNDNSPYHHVIDGFEKMLDMTKTKEDIEEINFFFSSFVNKRISQRKSHHQEKGTTVLFGENLKNGAKIVKRHKFLYETL